MRTWLVGIVVVGMLASACGSDSPTAPTPGLGTPLSAQIQAALVEATVDEYRAETIYQGVINDFGAVAPFVNILTAEQRHSAALSQLFVNRGLTPPGNTWTVATVPHYASLREACAAGVIAEVENIAIYDRHLLLDGLPGDVRQVMQNNRAASLLNHLPAFERCAR